MGQALLPVSQSIEPPNSSLWEETLVSPILPQPQCQDYRSFPQARRHKPVCISYEYLLEYMHESLAL